MPKEKINEPLIDTKPDFISVEDLERDLQVLTTEYDVVLRNLEMVKVQRKQLNKQEEDLLNKGARIEGGLAALAKLRDKKCR